MSACTKRKQIGREVEGKGREGTGREGKGREGKGFGQMLNRGTMVKIFHLTAGS
jgi:hypothetical protein